MGLAVVKRRSDRNVRREIIWLRKCMIVIDIEDVCSVKEVDTGIS